jgi:hypothetical protein
MSITSVLDANPDLVGHYYAEDTANQFVVATFQETEFRYESLGTVVELPMSSNVIFEGSIIGTIFFLPNYLGSIVAVKLGGSLLCGVITEGETTL